MRGYSRQVWQWCGTPEGKKFVALLALALLARLLLAPFFGEHHDLQDYVNWGVLFDQHPLGFYALASGWGVFEAPNYPPLMIYLCGALTGSYFGAAHVLGIPASALVTEAPLLVFWMKVPAILCDLGTVSVLYLLARRAFSERGALLITASYAFSPAILFDSAFWGQTDGIPVLFLLLALLSTLRSSGIRAGIFLGLALMLKLQSIIFAPLILLYLWRWAGWRRALHAASSMAVVALVICSPYVLPPSPGLLALSQNVQKWANAGHASDHGLNLWFLLGGSGLSASQPLIAFISPTSLGLLLFFVIFLLVLSGTWKAQSPHLFLLGAALASVAFFVVTTLQHERYLYPAVVLALAAALYAQRGWFFYVVASVTLFLNMLLFLLLYEPTTFGLSRTAFSDHWDRFFVLTVIAFVLSPVNIWLLGRMIAAYLRSLRQLSAAPASSAAAAAASPASA